MNRTSARELAAHLIYAASFSDDSIEQLLQERLSPEYCRTLVQELDLYAQSPDEKQRKYIQTVVTGVCREREQLNDYISKYAIGWNIGRISRLSKTFLQLAIYECLHVSDVPPSVAINEAVKLTKKYDEEAAKFVNGILGSFAAELQTSADGETS